MFLLHPVKIGDPYATALSEKRFWIVGPEGVKRRPFIQDYSRFVAIEFFDFLFQFSGEKAHSYSNRTRSFACTR
jgi:hypothetical protein